MLTPFLGITHKDWLFPQKLIGVFGDLTTLPDLIRACRHLVHVVRGILKPVLLAAEGVLLSHHGILRPAIERLLMALPGTATPQLYAVMRFTPDADRLLPILMPEGVLIFSLPSG